MADIILGATPITIYRPGRVFKQPFPAEEVGRAHKAVSLSSTTQSQASDEIPPDFGTLLLDDTSQSQTNTTSTATYKREYTNPVSVLVRRRGRINPLSFPLPPRQQFAEVDTSQSQSSGTAEVNQTITVTATESSQTQNSGSVDVAQDVATPIDATGQTQSSSTADIAEAATVALTETSQTQISAVVDPITGVDGNIDAIAGDATAEAAGTRVITGSATVQASAVEVVALSVTKYQLLNPQQPIFRRGSRVTAVPIDSWYYPKNVTGVVAVQADDATAYASGGARITGTVDVTATAAKVTARAPGLIYPYQVSSPVVPIIQRRDRLVLVVDEMAYGVETSVEKTGTVAALVSSASVTATGTRTITGSVIAASGDASAAVVSSGVTGGVGAFSGDSSVSIVGEVINTGSVIAISSQASAVAVGTRVITGSVIATSPAASVVVLGELDGFVAGVVTAPSGPASVAMSGSRGYIGAVAVQARPAVVASSGIVDQDDPPIFNTVDMLMSRVYRYTSLDFNRYLAQGEGELVFEVTQGALPTGLTLDTATGIVSGVPDTRGSFTAAITCTNINGSDETNEFRWIISSSIARNGLSINQNVVTIVGL